MKMLAMMRFVVVVAAVFVGLSLVVDLLRRSSYGCVVEQTKTEITLSPGFFHK